VAGEAATLFKSKAHRGKQPSLDRFPTRPSVAGRSAPHALSDDNA